MSSIIRPTSEKTFGGRLKTFRETKEINLVKLAKVLGISHGTLSDIENNKSKPSFKPLEALFRETDVNVSWLFTGEGEMIRASENEAEKDGGTVSIYKKEEEGAEPETADPGENVPERELKDKLIRTQENLIRTQEGLIRSRDDLITQLKTRPPGIEEKLQELSEENKKIIEESKKIAKENQEIKQRLKAAEYLIRLGDPEDQREEILKKRAV